MTIEMVESEIAHLGPILLPKVRHDRPQRPWWEAARLHSMRHYLGSDDRLVDVGSEMGDMTALFASWGVEVLAVEANPAAWPWLRSTFEANDLRLHSWFVGLLGDRREDFDWGPDAFTGTDDVGHYTWPASAFGLPDPATGFFHLGEHAEVAPVTTLDDICAACEFTPTAITIDVEGSELHVLRGAQHTLEDVRPKVWVSEHDEFAMDLYGHDLAELANLMEDAGYDRIFLAHDHERHVMYLPKEMGWKW